MSWSCLMLIGFYALSAVNAASHLRTVNIDPTFSRWQGGNVLYYIDPYYTATEATYIRSAFIQFQVNMKSCLKFTEVLATDSRYKVHVTPYNEFGVLQAMCYSYPGQSNQNVNSGLLEQIMVVARGSNGCLNGMLRPIMKIIAILVGRRNEHQRGDRDLYLTVNLANVVVANSYRLYNTSEAYWLTYPYDYCSITHNQPTDYGGGQVVFVPKSVSPFIPQLGMISNTDCLWISMIYQDYGCLAANCNPLDCPAAQAAAAAIAGASTASTSSTLSTSTMSSTTTSGLCPLSRFCTSAPSESGFLLGPYQFHQTMLLYNGPCVMEYQYDFVNNKVLPTKGPMPLTQYLPGPGGLTAPSQVDLAWNDLDPATNFASLTLNIASSANVALTCSADPNFATVPGAATCPTSSTTANPIAAAANSNVTSVSSQIFLGTYVIYQYVVLKGDTEIGLMSSDFSTLYTQTSGFLNGQVINKITAIQVIQDEQNINSQVFGVWGVAAGGIPYFGIANIPMDADTSVPLTGTINWTVPPKPLNQSITGCP